MINKRENRIRRHNRVRGKVAGTATIPRLCVFRSLKHIYAQIINDDAGKVLIGVRDHGIKGNKTEIATKVGELIAKKALEKKIEKIVFDRGGYKYHGRVKALAESARKAGLKF